MSPCAHDDTTTGAFLRRVREVLETLGVPPATTDAVLAIADGARPEVLDS
jgi:hypothetical protein